MSVFALSAVIELSGLANDRWFVQPAEFLSSRHWTARESMVGWIQTILPGSYYQVSLGHTNYTPFISLEGHSCLLFDVTATMRRGSCIG